jgi:hypothetical protein
MEFFYPLQKASEWGVVGVEINPGTTRKKPWTTTDERGDCDP